MTKYTPCRNFECSCMIEQGQDFCDNCDTPTKWFLKPAEKERSDGGALLGYDSDGQEFRIPLTLSGYAFYGMTGVGKTTLAMKTAIDASAAGIRLLILDPEGEWKNAMPRLCGKTEYYSTLRNLKINPFDLKDKGIIKVLLRESVLRGKETEQDFWDLSPQMNYILDECIDKSNSIPELIDNVLYFRDDDTPITLASIEKSKTALLVRLLPYKNNEVLKEIFYSDRSTLLLDKLDDRNIVVDLHPLAMMVAYETELRLIYNVITVAALRNAMSKSVTDVITNMLVADEAQMLVPRILQKVLVTDTFASTNFVVLLRKRGLSTLMCTQSPSNIEADIVKNMAVSVIHKLQSPDDAKLVAGLFGYTHYARVDHISKVLATLKPRQAIIKSTFVDRPIMIDSVNASFGKIDENTLASYVPEQLFNYSEAEQQFLQNVRKNSFVSVVERRAMLGWDERKYAEVVDRLIRNGMIEKVRISLGRGGQRVLYELAKERTVPSLKHEFYVNWIIGQLTSKGVVCRAEKVGPDIQIPSTGTAINVETGTSDIRGNIRKALKSFDKVIVCSDDKKLIQTLSEENKAQNIRFATMQDVIDVYDSMQTDADGSVR